MYYVKKIKDQKLMKTNLEREREREREREKEREREREKAIKQDIFLPQLILYVSKI